MPRSKPGIGDQELALLNYLYERGRASVGEVAADFGKAHGLARSTVLTMMERLRAKAYLRRRKVGGVYAYETTTGADEAVYGVVSSFVDKTLNGSVSRKSTPPPTTPVWKSVTIPSSSAVS